MRAATVSADEVNIFTKKKIFCLAKKEPKPVVRRWRENDLFLRPENETVREIQWVRRISESKMKRQLSWTEADTLDDTRARAGQNEPPTQNGPPLRSDYFLLQTESSIRKKIEFFIKFWSFKFRQLKFCTASTAFFVQSLNRSTHVLLAEEAVRKSVEPRKPWTKNVAPFSGMFVLRKIK